MAAHTVVIGFMLILADDIVALETGLICFGGPVVGIVDAVWRVNRHSHGTADEQKNAE